MKKLIAGFIAGVILTAATYLLLYPETRLQADFGRLLDRDVFYLEDGRIISGWIVEEDFGKFLVETEGTTLTLHNSDCESIKRDLLLSYIRDLI